MSKASEWAAAPTFPKEEFVWLLSPRWDTAECALYPSGPRLALKAYTALTPESAVKFAHWILAIFGEPDAAARP